MTGVLIDEMCLQQVLTTLFWPVLNLPYAQISSKPYISTNTANYGA
jgi:hypothetical protein